MDEKDLFIELTRMFPGMVKLCGWILLLVVCSSGWRVICKMIDDWYEEKKASRCSDCLDHQAVLVQVRRLNSENDQKSECLVWIMNSITKIGFDLKIHLDQPPEIHAPQSEIRFPSEAQQ